MNKEVTKMNLKNEVTKEVTFSHVVGLVLAAVVVYGYFSVFVW